jgi:prepilin-type N-terminal cleavage/methylation domain-containing protein
MKYNIAISAAKSLLVLRYILLRPLGLARTTKAFMLIELLVVVLIVGILAAIALPTYQTVVLKSKAAAMLPLLKALGDAQERHFLANGVYAGNIKDLDISISENCEDEACMVNGNYIIANSFGDIPVYINSTNQDTEKLTLTIVFDPEKFGANVNPSGKKYWIICYDRGNARFTKVCQSFGTSGSFNWGNGKAWILRF